MSGALLFADDLDPALRFELRVYDDGGDRVATFPTDQVVAAEKMAKEVMGEWRLQVEDSDDADVPFMLGPGYLGKRICVRRAQWVIVGDDDIGILWPVAAEFDTPMEATAFVRQQGGCPGVIQ